MTVSTHDRLYNLLPVLYRRLDETQGQPLRALMAVLESEFRLLEADIGAMYDDWFIETCDLWVVPYIADLLGIRHLQDLNRIPHQRRLVANSIAYRRRKGTLAVLEKVIHDATSWYARGVEFANLLAITQHVAHTQPDWGRTVDVKNLQGDVEIDKPLNTLAHTLDVDNTDQGVYNMDRIGVFLYRLRSFPIRRSFAHRIDEQHPDCFTFDSFGRDIHLFNHPQPIVHISQRAETVNLPLQISRANLATDLQEYRSRYGRLLKNDQPAESQYYGSDRSFHIELPSYMPNIKPSAVVSMDLSHWPAELRLPDKPAVVAVDVELGRIAFVDQEYLLDQADIDVDQCTIKIQKLPSNIIVNYNYGFSSEIGGGPYHRESRHSYPDETPLEINVAIGAAPQSGPPSKDAEKINEANLSTCFPTLKDAIKHWNDAKNPCGVIRILDNGVYDEALKINLPKGSYLSIVADTGVCPIIGKSDEPIIVYSDEAQKGTHAERQLHLNGMLLYGGLQIGSQGQTESTGKLNVTIEHCTLVKSDDHRLKPASVQSEQAIQGLELNIERSILGPLYLPVTTENLSVRYSIVDNEREYAIAADPTGAKPGPAVNLERSTVFGQVHAKKVTASEVIFVGPLHAPAPETKDQIRNCYVPEKSFTLQGEVHPSISKDIAPPRFTSTHYGNPAYAQLSLECPYQIRVGAADGSEMGVFHDLYQVLAEENLRKVLEEYLPLGLHASIHYVT